jgi:hypothetical protein
MQVASQLPRPAALRRSNPGFCHKMQLHPTPRSIRSASSPAPTLICAGSPRASYSGRRQGRICSRPTSFMRPGSEWAPIINPIGGTALMFFGVSLMTELFRMRGGRSMRSSFARLIKLGPIEYCFACEFPKV